ncbi:MAG: hypothetical protein JXD22_01415 [Sedimentisphaerales bacterium]|nr:hypothetical protein [Sedimentisphaerales bacterium]
MKKMWILITLAVVFLVSSVELTGCKKEEKPVKTDTVKTMKDEGEAAEKAAAEKADTEHPATEQPASDKPKDHPAH